MALYELRTYTLSVGAMAEAVKLYQEIGFPALQKGGHDKKLVGYFLADTGTINQLLHLRKFDDDGDRLSDCGRQPELTTSTHNADPRSLDGDRRHVSGYPNPHLSVLVYSDQTVADAHAASRCLSVCEKSERPKLQLHHSPIEIERKFLVANDEWKQSCSRPCVKNDTLEKERFFVEDAGATWHVDVYGGILQGVVIAEIELKQESQELILPRWIGKEVTGVFVL